jgi:hypothetical protein
MVGEVLPGTDQTKLTGGLEAVVDTVADPLLPPLQLTLVELLKLTAREHAVQVTVTTGLLPQF